MWIRLETTLRRGDVHEFEQLQSALSGLLPGHLLVPHQGLDDLLAYRVHRIEGGHRLLKHHSDEAATQVLHLRSEEHTSELQSPCNLVCRLLLEKKKNMPKTRQHHNIQIQMT